MTTWLHSDPRGPSAIPEAIRRAKYHKWSEVDDPYPLSSGDRMADLRALIVATYWTRANLAGAVEIVDASGRLQIDANAVPVDRDKALASRALDRTWQILSAGQSETGQWETVQGLRALPIEGGAFPVAIAMVVVAVAAVAAWGVWCAKEAAETTHKLSIDDNHARMLETQARVLEILNAHAEREKAEGRPLPLSESERAAIDALLGIQTTAAKGAPPPLGDAFARGVGGLGGVATVVALMVGAYLIWKE